jgi:tight adherence protein B
VHDATALLSAGLALHRRTGGDLPRLLRELARTLDERRRVEAEVGALTAQARFSARIVPLLPPVGLAGMALLDPASVGALVGTPLGLAVVGVAAMLDVAGAVAIRRLAAGIA